MKRLINSESVITRTFRLLFLLAVSSLGACSTMQATDTGFLKNRSEMTTSKDGGTAFFRSSTPVDPHQVRSISVEWAMPIDAVVPETERLQLASMLKTAISRETEALPKNVGGHPVVIRAVITRVETVNPALNVLTSVFLTVPLYRGGAAVEIEVLDAETRQPLASIAHAYFVPITEFKSRFSALGPAELALNAAAVELAKLLHEKS
ncbi:hypothetical protein RCH09_003496 [Actimicrobium sp. GrIS 1.19]|uniref:DUF3313 family protein n=1 Tax=Actimicrobium sp. GrIS 1.19 TaxID=3071708 RepID=UPI002E0095DB|nr:hypothetical protein [Actimicrobium sp. GrIS 1.19]